MRRRPGQGGHDRPGKTDHPSGGWEPYACPVNDPIARRAARVLLVDGTDRLLLMRGFDPRTPEYRYWFTVGGGRDADETSVQAAVRELAEETGLRLDAAELVGPVYQEVTEFPFNGAWYRQEQDFFLARVDTWQVDTAGFEAIERASVDGHRWWSAAELDTTTETYYPVQLPTLLRSLLAK